MSRAAHTTPRRGRGGALHAIVTDHDTTGARTLGRANNVDAGILVAAVPPDLRRRYELSWALLDALGKRRDVSGIGRHDDIDWEVLHAWIAAHRIEHVVVLDAQWAPPDTIAALAGLVATCHIDVWLVAHHPIGDTYDDALSAWPHHQGGEQRLLDAIRTGLTATHTAPIPLDAVAYPPVPDDNWPTFRAAAAATLTDADFATVDTTFRRAYRDARPMFDCHDLDEGVVLAHLRVALNACATVAEMVTVVRGVQVAAHRGGWLLQADPARLRDTAETVSRAAIHSPSTWTTLRAYRLPYRGAACACAALALTVGDMRTLTCAHVSADGTTVRHDGTDLPVPAGAHVFVAAQLRYRQIMGAAPTELLFADDNGPLNDRTLADAVRQPVIELGVPIIDITTSRTPIAADKRWRARWGLSLQKLYT